MKLYVPVRWILFYTTFMPLSFLYICTFNHRKHQRTLHNRRTMLPRIAEIPFEPRNEISNNVVFATSKASDQLVHTRSLIRAFASRLSII